MDVWFEKVRRLPELSTPPVFRDLVFSVFRDGDGFVRRFHEPKENDRPYAIGKTDFANGRETIRYLEPDGGYFSGSQSCFSHIALEELLLHWDRVILHASFVASPMGGLLFSGPSGIGKSTQADLWERYGTARLINGDRTILRPTGRGWLAYGSPYAGSSRCFVNERHPVRAIVTLEQGSACSLVRLPPAAAFQKLYAETTVNSWNTAFVEHVCSILTKLIAEVPVYRLVCTPDKTAVETLRAELLKGDAP